MNDIYMIFIDKKSLSFFKRDARDIYTYSYYKSIEDLMLDKYHYYKNDKVFMVHARTNKIKNRLLVKSDIKVIKIYDIEGINKLSALM